MIVEVAFVRKPTIREQETGVKETIALQFVQVAADSEAQAIAIVAVQQAANLKEVERLTPVCRTTKT